MRYFTTSDGQTWINKEDLMRALGPIFDELGACSYKGTHPSDGESNKAEVGGEDGRK